MFLSLTSSPLSSDGTTQHLNGAGLSSLLHEVLFQSCNKNVIFLAALYVYMITKQRTLLEADLNGFLTC